MKKILAMPIKQYGSTSYITHNQLSERRAVRQQHSEIVCNVFSVDEFCHWAGIGRTAAYAEMKAGKLVAKKVGRRTIIEKSAAEQWIASLPPKRR